MMMLHLYQWPQRRRMAFFHRCSYVVCALFVVCSSVAFTARAPALSCRRRITTRNSAGDRSLSRPFRSMKALRCNYDDGSSRFVGVSGRAARQRRKIGRIAASEVGRRLHPATSTADFGPFLYQRSQRGQCQRQRRPTADCPSNLDVFSPLTASPSSTLCRRGAHHSPLHPVLVQESS